MDQIEVLEMPMITIDRYAPEAYLANESLAWSSVVYHFTLLATQL